MPKGLVHRWLWLPLFLVGLVLVLTVRTDSPWLRALMFAPSFIAIVLNLRVDWLRMRHDD